MPRVPCTCEGGVRDDLPAARALRDALWARDHGLCPLCNGTELFASAHPPGPLSHDDTDFMDVVSLRVLFPEEPTQ